MKKGKRRYSKAKAKRARAVRNELNKESKLTKGTISKAQKMAKIENYAKDNNLTIAQAMIHFME